MSASVLIRRSVFARTGVAAVRAPAAQFRGYATRKPHADEPEAANAAEKVGKALKVSPVPSPDAQPSCLPLPGRSGVAS